MIDEAVATDEFKNYTGFNFQPLMGNRKNIYSITVRVNWRISFEFEMVTPTFSTRRTITDGYV